MTNEEKRKGRGEVGAPLGFPSTCHVAQLHWLGLGERWDGMVWEVMGRDGMGWDAMGDGRWLYIGTLHVILML
jgi:hypothetical protein